MGQKSKKIILHRTKIRWLPTRYNLFQNLFLTGIHIEKGLL